MFTSNFKTQFDGKTISIPETEMNCNFLKKIVNKSVSILVSRKNWCKISIPETENANIYFFHGKMG